MVRGRPVVLVRVASALAFFLAGLGIAIGQTGLGFPGITLATSGGSATLGISGASIAGVVVAGPAALDVGRGGISALLPSIGVANLAAVTPTSVDIDGRAATVVLSGVSVAGLAAVGSTTVKLADGSAAISLPGVNLAGLSIASTPLAVNLSGQGELIDLPTVIVGIQDQSLLLIGGDTVNQAAQAAQQFAQLGFAGILGPVEHLLNGLTFAGIAASGPGCTSADAGALAPQPASSIWMWSASTIRTTEHDGFQVASSGYDGECGSTLPLQALEKTNLPGMLWDASSALGLQRGTLHLGLTGGPTETETLVKPSAMLRDAGFPRAGFARMTSWSAGAFSLLTADGWYAGSAVGGAWGRTESRNFVMDSASDYATSTMVAAGLVGAIVPLTDAIRFDARGTLAYQRTVGEAHVDTLGIAHGTHTIETANAVLSGRLFGVFRQGDVTIRPFLQAGVTHNFLYGNELEIDGIAFNLEEADTSVFIATGLDFEMSKSLQLSLGVRSDQSSDAESLAARVGLSARLN